MTSAPFDEHRDVVRPEWIDDNGHPNMGYYGMACTRRIVSILCVQCRTSVFP